ncbi:MAG: hypothetical protein ISR58_05690 [Anaerolineales bacterium]|nr:hypothetical protein [Chloroflexota bacterium]MBL6980668.1 hypothetical protein [Anaerolineales bacterium]
MKTKWIVSIVVVLVLALSVTMTVWAQTAGESQSCDGDANTCDTGTGNVTWQQGAGTGVQRGQVSPVTILDLDDLGGIGNSTPPTGLNFLSEGVTFNLFGSAGPLSYFPVPVLICFPDPGAGAIRFWTGDPTRPDGGWQIFPTFSGGLVGHSGEICTYTNVPGTFTVIG